MSFKKSLFAVSAVAMMAGGAYAADSLTIAIVNNGHMINMQKVAEAYTADTGVKLNWVSLEEGVLREQVTSDTATSGGQYDIINIGMQEAPIWGAAGWIEPLNFGASYDMDDMLPAIRNGLSHNGTLYAAPFYGESSMVMYRKDLTDAVDSPDRLGQRLITAFVAQAHGALERADNNPGTRFVVTLDRTGSS